MVVFVGIICWWKFVGYVVGFGWGIVLVKFGVWVCVGLYVVY